MTSGLRDGAPRPVVASGLGAYGQALLDQRTADIDTVPIDIAQDAAVAVPVKPL